MGMVNSHVLGSGVFSEQQRQPARSSTVATELLQKTMLFRMVSGSITRKPSNEVLWLH